MKVLTVYLRLYLECLQKAFRGIRKNLWTLALPMGIALAWGASLVIASQLGMIGGIVMGLAMAALGSCYLYFVSDVVAGTPVKLQELKRSVGTYFWAVINVMFIFWIARLAVSLLGGAQAGVLLRAINVVALIAFNAVPETLYLRGTHGGMATLQESFEFLRDQLLPWAVPNVLLIAAVWGLPQGLGRLGLPGSLTLLVYALLVGALVHVAMVFRGHLYKALSGSSHRQRMFRYGER